MEVREPYAWMKRLGWALLGVLAVDLIQRGVLSHLPLWNVRPDLPLVVTCIVALLRGQTWGVGLGFALGLWADVRGGVLVGAHLVTLIMAGYGAGWMAGKIFRDTPLVPVAIVGGFSLLAQGAYLLLANLFGMNLPWRALLEQTALPTALYNMILAFLTYPLFTRWLRWVRGEPVVHTGSL